MAASLGGSRLEAGCSGGLPASLIRCDFRNVPWLARL
jgi:hypothetical protein